MFPTRKSQLVMPSIFSWDFTHRSERYIEQRYFYNKKTGKPGSRLQNK